MVLKVLNSPVRLNRKVSLNRFKCPIYLLSGDLHFQINLSSFQQAMKVLILLVMILPFTFLIFYWCHLTNSLGKAEQQ